MSLDAIIEKPKRLEGLFKRLGYQGKGLHELVTQAEPVLGRDIVRACRKVATIRNKAVHEEGYRLYGQALQDFSDAADYAAGQLSALLAPDPVQRGRVGARAQSLGTARPAAERPVFGKRTTDQAAAGAKITVRDYLVAGGLAIGAAGLWFWNEIRD